MSTCWIDNELEVAMIVVVREATSQEFVSQSNSSVKEEECNILLIKELRMICYCKMAWRLLVVKV